MAEEADSSEDISLPIVWVGADETPIAFCNQILFQMVAENECVLTLGNVVTPAVFGSQEERLEQIRQFSYLPANTVARVSLTRKRVEELIEVLQSVLDQTTGGRENASENA